MAVEVEKLHMVEGVGDQGFARDMERAAASLSKRYWRQARADQPRETTLPLFVKCIVAPPF
jgi:hypothetical protein